MADIVQIMKGIAGLNFLLAAFAPLLFPMTLLFGPSSNARADFFIAAIWLVPVFTLSLALRSLTALQVQTLVSTKVRNRDGEVLTFISSFMLPIVVAVFSSSGSALLAALFLLATLGLVYVRAELYYLNPIFLLLGLRAFQIEQPSGAIVMVLARAKRLPQSGSIQVRFFSDSVAFKTSAS